MSNSPATVLLEGGIDYFQLAYYVLAWGGLISLIAAGVVLYRMIKESE